MKAKLKKSLAILLCTLLMLSALPVQALAAGPEEVVSDTSVSEAAESGDSTQPEDTQPPADDSAMPENGAPAAEDAEASTAPESDLPPPSESVAAEGSPDASVPPEASAATPGTAATPAEPDMTPEDESPILSSGVMPENPHLEYDRGFQLYCELQGLENIDQVGLACSRTEGVRLWESIIMLEQREGGHYFSLWFDFENDPHQWQSGGYYFEIFLNPHDTWEFVDCWTIATFYISSDKDASITVDNFSFATPDYTMGSGDALRMEGQFTTTRRYDTWGTVAFYKVDDDAPTPTEPPGRNGPDGEGVFEDSFNLYYTEIQGENGPAWRADFSRSNNNPYFTKPGRWFAWLRLYPQIDIPGVPVQEAYAYLGSIEVQNAPAMLLKMRFDESEFSSDASINHHAGTVYKYYGYTGRPDVTAITPIFEIPDGATLTVDGIEQVSGVSTQDFSGPVTYRVTAADGITYKEYVATIEIAAPDTAASLNSFRFSDLPAGSEELVVDHSQQLIYAVVPGNTASLVLTPVFSIPYRATANLQSGQPVDFEGSTQNPVELTITAEDGVTSKTYRIVVALKGAPNYHGQVFTYKDGQTQTIAGRRVVLHDINRPRYYNNPVATTTTDTSGRYAFYTDAIPGIGEMDLAVWVETYDAPGEEGSLYGEHGVPQPGTSYAGYYNGAMWVPFLRVAEGEATDFHLFAGTYLWKSRVVDAETGLGVPNAVVRGAGPAQGYGYANIHNTDENGVFLAEPISAFALEEYLRHPTAQTVFGAYKAGYRDTKNIVVELTDIMFEELKTNASFTTPVIKMVPASNAAAILSFAIGGHTATINEHDKTIRLMLPYIDSIDLANVAPQFTLSALAAASPRSGTRLNFSASAATPVPITVTAEDTLTTATYHVTVEMEPDIQVDYSGTFSQYDGSGKAPAAGFTFQVQDTWGKIIQPSVVCDTEGKFSFTITGSQANRGVYISRSQSIGQLVKDDLSGFYSASVLVRLQPGAGNAFTFAKAPSGSEIRGKVQDPSGNNVAGAEVHYLSKLTESTPDGSFAYTIDADWLRYHHTSFVVRKEGFNQAGFTVNMQSAETFRSLLEDSYIDVGVIILSPATGSPVTLGRVSALPQYTQRGKTVQTFVHYTGSRTLENAQLTVQVPSGVTIEPGSLSNPAATLNGNTITLAGTLEKGREYTVGFWASASTGYTGGSFAITAQVTADGKTWLVGESQVSLTDLSLEVPHQVGLDGSNSLPFTISGQATAGPDYRIDIDITDPDGRPAQPSKTLTGLPTAGVGPWFKVADVVLQNAAQSPGQYTLLATLKDGGGNPVAYSTATLYVVPDAIKLTGINMFSHYFNVTAPQPVTNSSFVSACAYVNSDLSGRDPINLHTTWQNDSDVVSAIYVMETSHGTFLSKMSERAGGKYNGRFDPGAYMGSGTAHIYLEFGFEDGSAARFLVAKLLLLIDPSGYVYDKTSSVRIEGATATLEVQQDGEWVLWPAEEFGQHNPQTTDAEGCYGWFVPEGEYRVLVSAEGYAPYTTDADPAYGVINVLPPREDIYIGLTPVEAVLSGLEVTATPTKTQYHAGQLLDLTGLVVTALYDDGSSRVLGASEYTTSPANGAPLATAGSVQVSVRHKAGDVEKAARFTVPVAPVVLTGLEVAAPPAKTGYNQGEALELAGLSLAARYSDGSSRALAEGEYTAIPAAGTLLNTPGDLQVSLRYQEGGTTQTCNVTLRVAAPSVVLATGVTLDKLLATLAEGDTLQLAASVQPPNSNNPAVSWASSDPAVATVDAGGLVAALKAGSATITVTTQDGGFTSICSITVQPAITGVKLAQTTLRLARNQKATMGAVVTYSNGSSSTSGLAWKSSDDTVATVTQKGVITGKSVKKNSTATITATAENGRQATVKVTVLKSSAKAVKVTKVAISGGSKAEIGKPTQLKAKVSPGNATGAAITWKSNKPGVIQVDATGKLTALQEGSAKITLKSGTASASVTVTAVAPVKRIQITGKPASLKKGSSVALGATVTSSAGYTGTPKLTWSSSNKAIATVSSKGVVKAKKAGTVTITVKAANGKFAKVKLKVTK